LYYLLDRALETFKMMAMSRDEPGLYLGTYGCAKLCENKQNVCTYGWSDLLFRKQIEFMGLIIMYLPRFASRCRIGQPLDNQLICAALS